MIAPAGTGARQPGEIDAALARQRAHGRRRRDADARRRSWSALPGAGLLRAARPPPCRYRQAALVEIDERRADLDALARLGEQPRDPARLRRGHLDHRLLGLDRDERLIGDDMVAFRDMPGDDLGLLQPFAEIGQREGAHE